MTNYLLTFFLHLLLSTSCNGFCIGSQGKAIAPETTLAERQDVKKFLDLVYGDEKSEEWEARRIQARATGEDDQTLNISEDELVYGELGLDALATIMDAVGVQKGDHFMDIGSGDGLLVSGASLLYSGYLEESMGIEIVPELFERSLKFERRLEEIVEQANREDAKNVSPSMSCFELGNVYEPSNRVSSMFSKTTLAVCFATTWSKGIPGRKLARLSEALGLKGQCPLPSGARLVIIDGVLDPKDGYDFVGQFKLYCPDTAPYSMARLYIRT